MVSTRARFSSSDSADRSLEMNFMENHINKFNEFKKAMKMFSLLVEIKRKLAKAIQLLIFHVSEVAEP